MIKKGISALLQISIIIIAVLIYAEFFSINKTEMNKQITKSLIQNQSFLIKRELIIESIIKKEEKGRFWGTDKKALIIAKGKVPYGINFKQFLDDDITISAINKSIEIILPEPRIYDVIVTDLIVYDVRTGIFSSTNDYLQKIYQTAFSEAKETLSSEASKQFDETVNNEIKNEILLSISQVINALYGDFTVSIRFKAMSSDSINKINPSLDG